MSRKCETFPEIISINSCHENYHQQFGPLVTRNKLYRIPSPIITYSSMKWALKWPLSCENNHQHEIGLRKCKSKGAPLQMQKKASSRADAQIPLQITVLKARFGQKWAS